MEQYQEGLLTIAIYIFIITAFSLPFIVARVYYKIIRVISRADKLLKYAQQNEEESRKYRND